MPPSPVVGKLTNCRRCNRIFRLLRSSYCPECMTILETLIQQALRKLACQPQTLLDDLARGCAMSMRDAEILYFDGLLGAASAHVLIYCKRCGKTQNQRERQGRYCVDCAAIVDEEHFAGASSEDGTQRPRTQRA